MLLTYKNLKIRNAVAEDAPLLCKWWNDGRVMEHAGFPNGLNTSEEAIIKGMVNDSDDTYRRLIIELEEKPIGEMSFRNVGDMTAELGIKICDFDKQEKGYGTTLIRMLITGLLNYGYKKIIIDTNLNNHRAQHVYEKLGFNRLRVNYNTWKNQLGEPQSFIDYELDLTAFKPIQI